MRINQVEIDSVELLERFGLHRRAFTVQQTGQQFDRLWVCVLRKQLHGEDRMKRRWLRIQAWPTRLRARPGRMHSVGPMRVRPPSAAVFALPHCGRWT